MIKAVVIYNKSSLSKIMDGKSVPCLERLVKDAKGIVSFQVEAGDLSGEIEVEEHDFEQVCMNLSEYVIVERERPVHSL